jgi:outer membrane protein TolC
LKVRSPNAHLQRVFSITLPGLSIGVSDKELRSMNCRNSIAQAWFIVLLMVATGCHSTQPFYFHDDGDLSHLLNHMTEIAYPDIEYASLAEVTHAEPPVSVADPDFDQFWDIKLEECVSMALHNSAVIRNAGAITQIGFADGLLSRTAASPTSYDASISETNVLGVPRRVDSNSGSVFLSEDRLVRATEQGVEDALSEFDASLFSSFSMSSQDRPRNVETGNIFNPQLFTGRNGNFLAAISKKTATGGVFTFRNRTTYTENNIPIGLGRALPSDWVTEMEIEVQYPLMRGRGALINRIPVTLARINTDISLAEFEGSIRNLVLDVENAYWDLHSSYHALETARAARDSALGTWHAMNAKARLGKESARGPAQVLEQYHFFSAALETAQNNLFDVENRLRWLLGLTTTDGRIMRPSNNPTKARVNFDWETVKQDSLFRSPELRQQKWRIKQAELELIAARNQMLPRVNLFSTYSWVGSGDHLVNADRNGLSFPEPGSTAFDELFGGDFQEFSAGLDFQPNRFGARRARSGVRNKQLRLARAKKRLEEMELQQIHLVSNAWRRVKLQYSQSIWQFNRWMDTLEDVKVVKARYSADLEPLDQVLDAHRRKADSQIAFHQALTEYNKAIALVHFYSSTLLKYNSIHLAEGPWPDKAYSDAHEKARARDASYYLNYGATRPSVVSRGPAANRAMAPIIGDEAVGSGLRRIEPTLEEVRVAPSLLPPAAAPKTPAADHVPIGRRPDEGPDLQAPIRAELPQHSRRQSVRTVSDQRPIDGVSNPLRNASYAQPSLR